MAILAFRALHAQKLGAEQIECQTIQATNFQTGNISHLHYRGTCRCTTMPINTQAFWDFRILIIPRVVSMHLTSWISEAHLITANRLPMTAIFRA